MPVASQTVNCHCEEVANIMLRRTRQNIPTFPLQMLLHKISSGHALEIHLFWIRHSNIRVSPILLYSILFYSILFYSILFHSIPFHSIPFHSIIFFEKIKWFKWLKPNKTLANGKLKCIRAVSKKKRERICARISCCRCKVSWISSSYQYV